MIIASGQLTEESTNINDIERILEMYGDMLYRICVVTVYNRQDAEDTVSETMIKYMYKSPKFKSLEHEKAWLIRVATNICKDIKRYRSRHNCIDIDEVKGLSGSEESSGIIEAVMNLPDKYKTVLYLHYIEGYKTDELAEILNISPSAARKRLQYGRRLLKLDYEKEQQE